MTLKQTPFLIAFLIIFSSCQDKVSYLDDDYPGLKPKKYALGIINIDGRFQQNLTMSPDGKEHLFTLTDSILWRYESILSVRNIGNKITLDTLQFVKDFPYENQWFIGEPMLSPDNQHLYFVADYPPDIWVSERNLAGDWVRPKKVSEISTNKDDWYVSLSQLNHLYFTNGTLFKSTLNNGNHSSIVKVESAFNEKDVRDPCISPNEDYLIFTHTDTLNNQQSDLFISFKDDQGNWSAPQNLGPEINTEHREFAPYISPDEQFLFFSRRDQWQHAKFSNIYWVNLGIIDKFRN